MAELSQLRHKYSDWLLTLQTVLMILILFVFAPLQAMGIFAFRAFAIVGLLTLIGAMLIISNSRLALALMSAAFVANAVIFFMRLFYEWPYNLHILVGAWFVIAITLGAVVASAVFRPGRITYHRVIGAILLYLLIAVTFATLFAFVGLLAPNSFKGVALKDDAALANEIFYLSFVTLTSTGYGDIIPIHPIARSLCNLESVIGQLYPATLLARLIASSN